MDFNLPERVGEPPVSGPLMGRKIDFNAVRKSFFNAMGWNPQTGVPSPKCLDGLDLVELVGQFI